MDRLPSLKALRVFQVAAELGSFKLASERLNVTQAAVSQQIRLLESYFGEALFVRLNREVNLTPAGIRLLPYLQKGFKSIEEGVAGLSKDPMPQQLKITSVPSFAARWLIPRLGAFQEKHPDLSSFVSTSCDLHDFSDDSQDIAIRFSSGGFAGLAEEPISSDYILPLCHPMLVERINRGECSLAELPQLIDESDELEALNTTFKQLFAEESKVVLQMEDSNLLMDAALNGQGVAPVRFSLAYEYIARGQLVCPINIYWNSPYTYFLVAPSHHFKRHKVTAFKEWIISETAVIEEQWQQFSRLHNLVLQPF